MKSATLIATLTLGILLGPVESEAPRAGRIVPADLPVRQHADVARRHDLGHLRDRQLSFRQPDVNRLARLAVSALVEQCVHVRCPAGLDPRLILFVLEHPTRAKGNRSPG